MYDNTVLPDMAGIRPDSTISLVQFDPVKEMEILRNVVLRDALVALLTEERRKFMTGGDLCAKTVLQALLEARKASLDVIEAVKRWRFTLVKPEEFTVRGKNYLVTMATDMNFLATGLAPLKEAFGLELGTGNPFALPCLPLSSATNIGRTARGAKANVGGMPRPQTESRGGNSTPGAGSKAIRGTTATRPTQNNSKPAAKAGMLDTTATPTARSSAFSVDHPGDRGEGKGAKQQSRMTTEDTGGGNKDDKEDGALLDTLSMLGDVNGEQRGQLAMAQGFLEAELARTGAQTQQASWWGFHRWTERPWVYVFSNQNHSSFLS